MTPAEIATTLRQRREELGMTQEAAAGAAGMATANWSRLESGRHAPRLDVLSRAAAAVGLVLELRPARRRW